MRHKRTAQVLTIFLFVLLVSSVTSCSSLESIGVLRPRPNFVIILTDDMDLSLLPYMKNANALIAQQGATLTNYFVTSPVCCPSRASMLRGQYPHNTNILANSSPEGGFRRFFFYEEEAETLAVWLNREGYNTSLLGKYLNGYPIPAGRDHVPPGWTDWHVFLYQEPEDAGESNYFDYLMNENGNATSYGAMPEDYSTDVIAQRALDFMNRSIADHSPFFVLVSVYAPHGPNIPAPRHAELFPELTYPKSPSFNEADLSDKPSTIQELAMSGDETDAGDADQLYVKRARSLQAVDELVATVVEELEQNGALENTYIFFTSDNGFHMGEHGLPSGKGTPYEEDIHVPFLVRGPDIQANTIVTRMAANIDIAPTILELAGIEPVDFLDGRSLMPLLQPEIEPDLEWRKALVIEMGRMPSSTSSVEQQLALIDFRVPLEFPALQQRSVSLQIGEGAFRTIRAETFTYAEHKTGEREYYDLLADPYQLDNVVQSLDPQRLTALHSWLEQLRKCIAEDCRRMDASIPVELQGRP